MLLQQPSARRLLIIGAVAAVAALAWVIMGYAQGRLGGVALLAPALIFFAAFKASLALEAGVALRRGGEAGSRLISVHGSRAGVRAWIWYKGTAAVTAFAAALVCLILVPPGAAP